MRYYQGGNRLSKGSKVNLKKLKAELVKKSNNQLAVNNAKADMLKDKSKAADKSKSNVLTEQKDNKYREHFAGYTITEHFIQRAQERFGLRDFDEHNKNYNEVSNWLNNLLINYDEIEKGNENQCWYIRYKSIIIVYYYNNNTFVTCYPITYDTVNKRSDTLKVSIAKKKLAVDTLTKDKVEEALRSLYYRELRNYSKDLSKYYQNVADLYQIIANSKHNSVVDTRIKQLVDYKSIISSLEIKAKSFYDVAYDNDIKEKEVE